MSIRFFNRNQPLLNLVNVLLAVVLFFLIPSPPTESVAVLKLFDLGANYYGLYKAYIALVLLLVSVYLNVLVNESAWLKGGFSYLPGVLFLVMSFCISPWLTYEVASIFLLIIALVNLFRQENLQYKATDSVFFAGVICSFGAYLHIQFLLFALGYLISWHYLRPYIWRETFWFFMGIIIPVYLLMVALFLLGFDLNFSQFLTWIEPEMLPITHGYALLLAALFAIFSIPRFFNRAFRNTLKSRQLAIFFTGITISIFAYSGLFFSITGQYWVFFPLLLPVSVVMSVSLGSLGSTLKANLLLYGFIFSCFILVFLSVISNF
ncbi:MAG: hypothetical protein ACXITV_12500 [Luteibaculaceae bacterium]